MINLDHNFNAVFTAEDAKSYKPNPEFFNFVNEQLGEVDEHIHIAVDMDKDIVPAQKAGWRVISIDRTNESASIASLMDTIDNL